MSEKQLSRIERMRQKYKTDSERKNNNGQGPRRSTNFPFWDAPLDVKSTIHILADSNEENDDMYFVDQLEHVLTINGKEQRIACRKMHGQSCPICDLSKQYYDAGDKETGFKYYRRVKSIVRVLVLDDPRELKEGDESFEGKVSILRLTSQLMKKLRQDASDPDLGDFTDWDTGTPFNIVRTKQGEHNNYSSSFFSRRSSPIPKEMREQIEPLDLSTLLPADPGLEKVTNFLNAHINGGDIDDSDDGQEEKAPERKEEPKKEVVKEEVKKETPAQTPAEEVEDQEEETEVETVSTEDDGEPEDILATLRKRKNARAAARK